MGTYAAMLHLSSEQRQQLAGLLLNAPGAVELWVDDSGADGPVVRLVGCEGDVPLSGVEWVDE